MLKERHPSSSFFDEDIKAFIKCANASDAYIASLFLKFPNMELFDELLSVVRNPAFNPGDVTFGRAGDILCHVGRARVEDTSRLVASKANSQSLRKHSQTIPHVVVEFALEVLREEMMRIISRSFLRGERKTHEPQRSHWIGDSNTSEWRPLVETLFNCSLVHSSWLLQARRAVGIFLRINGSRSSISTYIRNPCFGHWTRDLHLHFSYAFICLDLLGHLFERIPNVKFLALKISNSNVSGLDDSAAYAVSACISRLRRVEEISLSIALPDRRSKRAPPTLFSNLLAFPGGVPSLKTLRLFGLGFVLSREPPCPMDWVNVAPNLAEVHVQLPVIGTGLPEVQPGYNAFTWAKDNNHDGITFAPGRLVYMTTRDSQIIAISDREKEALSMLKTLRLWSLGDRDTQNVVSILQCCSSVTTVELSVPSFGEGYGMYDAQLQCLAAIPKVANEIRVYFDSIVNPVDPKKHLKRMDEILESWLTSFETKTCARQVKMYFVMEFNDFGYKMDIDPDFPRFTSWFMDKSVHIKVNKRSHRPTVSLKYMYP